MFKVQSKGQVQSACQIKVQFKSLTYIYYDIKVQIEGLSIALLYHIKVHILIRNDEQLYCKRKYVLFSSTKGRKMNTKVGLHTTITIYPPCAKHIPALRNTQTFKTLPNDLGK